LPVRYKNLLLIFVFAMLNACGNVPETHYYTVELKQLSQQNEHIGALLHIQAFDASTVLKYDKLMYKTSPYEIKYDAYRRWVATPSTLLSEKAVEYFRQSLLFDHVVMDMPQSREGYSLFGYVNHFEESLKNGQRLAVVSVAFDVYNLANRKLELHKNITQSAPIQNSTIDGIMAAMSSSVQSVFDELAKEMLKLNK
jgi:ABC-type uncharacterized transport system auxiliary subunit